MKGSKKQRQESEVSVPGLDFEQLERLLLLMAEHGLEEFEYVQGDLRIRLRKGVAPSSGTGNWGPPTASTPGSVPGALATAQASGIEMPLGLGEESRHPAPPRPEEQQHLIKSPIVGTYYAGPNPDAPPFVKVGDVVEAGQTVCIIEAMKLMNEIEADINGEVARILVENGQPVEYGEPLFALRPTGKKK
jgi:acetyl-CoA carboxylase biotin carboxyl carrier protein